jgi:hypothetical protein
MAEIGEQSLGNTFSVADSYFKMGYRGTFQNMMLAVSNNLTCV